MEISSCSIQTCVPPVSGGTRLRWQRLGTFAPRATGLLVGGNRVEVSINRITRMKVHLHCCGSVYDFMDDLIECGVDVFNPARISAKDVEPQRLKSAFGDRIIFYGGAFDPVQTPPHRPPEAAYETVKKNILTLSQGGGYIFAGVHNIPGDRPTAHLRAILEAYRDCRDALDKPT